MSMKTGPIFSSCLLIAYVCANLFSNFAHTHSPDFPCMEETSAGSSEAFSSRCHCDHSHSTDAADNSPPSFNKEANSGRTVQGYCIACDYQFNSTAVLFYFRPGLQSLSSHKGSPISQDTPCAENHSFCVPIRGPPVA